VVKIDHAVDRGRVVFFMDPIQDLSQYIKIHNKYLSRIVYMEIIAQIKTKEKVFHIFLAIYL
jgi:hypothetical protein